MCRGWTILFVRLFSNFSEHASCPTGIFYNRLNAFIASKTVAKADVSWEIEEKSGTILKHIYIFFTFFTVKQRNTPARNNFMNISTCTFEFYWHKLSTRQPITDIFLNLSFFVLNAFFGWFVVVVPISWAVVHGSGPCIFGVLQSSSPWTVSSR